MPNYKSFKNKKKKDGEIKLRVIKYTKSRKMFDRFVFALASVSDVDIGVVELRKS